MTKLPKDANTFSEWSKPGYAREHQVMFVLVGFLVGAIVWPLSIFRPETQQHTATSPQITPMPVRPMVGPQPLKPSILVRIQGWQPD